MSRPYKERPSQHRARFIARTSGPESLRSIERRSRKKGTGPEDDLSDEEIEFFSKQHCLKL